MVKAWLKATANKAVPGKGVRRTDNSRGGKAASNTTATCEAMRKAASPEPAMAETTAAKAPVTSTSAAASERQGICWN
jgi:hypothetical protein